ncbi:hypothetical protein AAF712_012538 [Marasmius tenuissimus]|uniref:SWIM-type domain-containing protein n=1 Tax=Marasmius tenuissimus TaxID=585030 RepID=A0ABR2ZI66_9AGAR
MSSDELAEIDGIKPNVTLEDGEETEVKSKTRQVPSGAPTNARTCKHLQSLLGEEYEAARVKMKNPDGPAPKAPKKPASKARAAPKSKKAADKDEDEDETDKKPKSKGKARAPAKRKKAAEEEDEEEEETEKPKSKGKGRAPAKRRKVDEEAEEDGNDDEKEPELEKPKSKGKRAPARSKKAADDMDVDEKDEKDGKDEDKRANERDELASFDGIKPKILLADGEEREVKSQNSKSTYKVKRTQDHFYCNCPAWRNQSKKAVNARTCKHLQGLLGEAYEEARIKYKTAQGESADVKPSSSKKPASTTKPASTKPASKKADTKPASKKADTKPQSKSQTNSKGKRKREEVEEVIEEEEEAKAEEEEDGMDTAEDGAAIGEDELASINGIKPKVYLKDGEETEVKSQTSSSTYKVKRTWDHYYCTCPAWRNQGGVPTNARTCKHLQSLLGDKYEAERIKLKNPDGPQPGSPSKPKRAKKDKGDGDDAKTGTPELLLANKWDLVKGADPTGWWISEKLDGVRTYYDGKRMVSRLGNPFTPPQWFLDKLPKDVILDGELFGGRGEFQSTVSIVKTVNSPHWKNITFQVFDIPSHGSKPFEERFKLIKELFGEGGSHACDEVVVVEQEKSKGRDHVLEKLKEIETLGGEGLMLRKPKSQYEGHRSSSLLKVKTFYDAEAIVTGHADGSGKNKGVCGALKCKMESGKTFNCGSGLTDKQRKNPPKVGTIITYRFQELTKDGVPRFPTFVGEAPDKTEPKDAEVSDRAKKPSEDEE